MSPTHTYAAALLYVFLLSYSPLSISADEETGEAKEHAIDSAMEADMERNASTAGQVEAIDAALKKWDGLLNEKYAQLMDTLDAGSKDKLRKSQRAWMEWRDQEIELRRSVYAGFRGTMYVPMSVYAVMNVTRERALYLEKLLELVETHGE